MAASLMLVATVKVHAKFVAVLQCLPMDTAKIVSTIIWIGVKKTDTRNNASPTDTCCVLQNDITKNRPLGLFFVVLTNTLFYIIITEDIP